MKKALFIIGGLGLLAGAAVFGLARYGAARLAQARALIAEGDTAKALEILQELHAGRPGDGGIAYELGKCEIALDRPGRAERLWRRFPHDDPRAPEVAIFRARYWLDQGAMSVARDILEPIAARSGEAWRLLARLYQSEGRVRDARALYRTIWAGCDDPIGVLSELWKLENEPFPLEAMRAYLAVMEEKRPDDPDVRLGKANVAIHKGELAAAEALLTDRVGAFDPVARAMALLELALARRDHALFLKAAAELPADRFDDSEIAGLQAQEAELAGDRLREIKALEARLALEPGNTSALDRLAELMHLEGDETRSRNLRRQGELARTDRARYVEILKKDRDGARANELRDICVRLGLGFEARSWSKLCGDRSAPAAPRRSRVTLLQAIGVKPRAQEEGAPTESPLIMPRFEEIAADSGALFTYRNGASELRQLPETMSGGVGLLDFDRDGKLDIFFVQGGAFPPPEGAKSEDRLFRNRGDGGFEDVSAKAGLAEMEGGYGHGLCIGDYNNDGYSDIFITRWEKYQLLKNRGDGTFEDATAAAGLARRGGWPTSAAWGDFDRDGDLDLYVCRYLVWDAEHPKVCRETGGTGRAFYCTPRDFPAEPDRLYRNDGGRFTDITDQAGIVDRDGRGLGVLTADLDGDGKIDIYVANDMSANFFFRNLGNMKFAETAFAAGNACNSQGGYQAGMGIDCGDLDGDGEPDLVVTNFYGESTTFYRNLGAGFFADHTAEIGLAAPSRHLLGFGVSLFDSNNDGLLDLATANGHVNDGRPRFARAMPMQLMLGTRDARGAARVVDVTDRAGAGLNRPRIARGLARGDLDGDGRLDLVVVAQNEPAAILMNRTLGAGHWLALALVGAKSPRGGEGARITLTSRGAKRVRILAGGGSYESASDPRVHFGLGAAEIAESVEIRWPSGALDRIENLASDRTYEVIEGGGGRVRELSAAPIDKK